MLRAAVVPGKVGDERRGRPLPGLGRRRGQDQDAADGQPTGGQSHQPIALVGVQPLHRPGEDDGPEGLLGHHLEVVEDRLGPDVQAPLDAGLDRRLAGLHPVGVDARPHQRLHERPVAALPVEHPAAHALDGIDGGRGPPRRTRVDGGYGRLRQLRGRHAVDRRLENLDVVDHQVQHPRHRPGEPHDLVDDEVHVPAGRLADQPLDVDAHRLVGQDGDGRVHEGGPVHQGQRLAEPRLPLHAHGGEFEEQLVELTLETGRQVARGPPPLDLGVDVGHHLGQVLGSAGGVEGLRMQCGGGG